MSRPSSARALYGLVASFLTTTRAQTGPLPNFVATASLPAAIALVCDGDMANVFRRVMRKPCSARMEISFCALPLMTTCGAMTTTASRRSGAAPSIPVPTID